MSYQTTLTPINGAEVKKIAESVFVENIAKVPMLREGLAFKQVKIHFRILVEAYPEDCPCPAGGFQIIIGLDEGTDVEFDKDVKKLDLLEQKLHATLNNAETIQKFLQKHRPTFDKVIDVSDEGIPDELRIAHKLKIPVIAHKNGKTYETHIDASQLKVKVS